MKIIKSAQILFTSQRKKLIIKALFLARVGVSVFHTQPESPRVMDLFSKIKESLSQKFKVTQRTWRKTGCKHALNQLYNRTTTR